MTKQEPDPRGRLDVLASKMIERLAEKNPVAKVMHEAYGDEINGLLEHYLAPRDRRGRIKRVRKAG